MQLSYCSVFLRFNVYFAPSIKVFDLIVYCDAFLSGWNISSVSLFLHTFKIIFQRFCFFLQKPNLLWLSFSFCFVFFVYVYSVIFNILCLKTFFCEYWATSSSFLHTSDNLKSCTDFSGCGTIFFFVIFFCIYQLPRVSQPGFFFYLSAFKKC